MSQDDRRIAPRIRTLLKGTIHFANRSRAMECLVRNLSETGVRIECAAPELIPEQFELTIPQKARTYQCRVAWRRPHLIGAAFTIATEAETPATLAERIAALETQNARLKRLVLDRERASD